MPLPPIPPEKLRRECTQDHYSFETTADLEVRGSIIGQPRGTQAIDFGIGIRSQGYNIFVLGETGTGRTTAIRKFLEEKAAGQSTPPGWVYVNNFSAPHQPRAIKFAPGESTVFKRQMDNLLEYLKDDLPKAFDTEAYRDEMEKHRERFDIESNEILQAIQMAAAAKGFTLRRTASGLNLVPTREGKILTPEEMQQMTQEEREKIELTGRELGSKLEDAFYQIRQKELGVREAIEALNREVARTTISHHFARIQKEYDSYDEVQVYLDEMQQDVLDHLAAFLPGNEQKGEPDFRRYEVNIFVDNSEISGAPVVVEPNPTYANLLGRIEYETHFGAMSTHFTNIKPGSLHEANGGYLVINARDLLQHPFSWEALKRAIKQKEIRLQSPSTFSGGNQVLSKSLDPEPIPLEVKVILLGTPHLYYMLYELEEDFDELFKVKADFDTYMPRDQEHEEEYAYFIATRCHEENLLHFDRAAVAKVVEYGARLADHQDRLSTRFGALADLVYEANYWAKKREADHVTEKDVRRAIEESIYRSNRVETELHELFDDNVMMVSTDGQVAGQVNGLSVFDMGDFSFGQPSRITAQTYMGEAGVVNIEREVNMAGPIHNKGLLTLVGYLGATYAQKQPLSLSASLAFEQNYGGVEGDSASSTELYALLSSLSGLPIHQGRAVTGSVNQKGEIQPIGGATEKIEGFFKLCKARGLTGDQGVLIPAANVRHLMLSEDVLEAVKAGEFNVWAVSTLDEGIELLMGIPAGEQKDDGSYPDNTVHGKVQKRLLSLAVDFKNFGQSGDEEE